jgi:hypothetical protein
LPNPQGCAFASFMNQPVYGTFTCDQSGNKLGPGSQYVTVRFAPDSRNFINPTIQQVKITVNEATHKNNSELLQQAIEFDQNQLIESLKP